MSLFSSKSNLSKHPIRTSSNIEGTIDLTDNTRPQDLDSEQEEVVANVLKKTQSRIPNPTRLREELARRKYAKYSEERYNSNNASEDDASGVEPHSSTSNLVAPGALKSTSEDNELLALKKTPTGRLRRGQQKVKGLLNPRKKTKTTTDKGAEIDVLYENQRGSWFFGIPLFSSKSLLNFDASSWTNAFNKPSAVNITNAQLPDPSWEWAWRSWYVDMSLDVDEQGWEYSFMFQNTFPWHGTHPWFHSFVRRRRWIRKRVRRHKESVLGQLDCVHEKHHTESHKLNADYFSIHPAGEERRKSGSTSDLTMSGILSTDQTLVGDTSRGYDDELDDLPTLLKRLKRSTVDREKIKLVLEYMDHAGEDTHYLADQIPHIMSFLIFQDSRRQLLARMLIKVHERRNPTSPPPTTTTDPTSTTSPDEQENPKPVEKGKQRLQHTADDIRVNGTETADHQPPAEQQQTDHDGGDELEQRKTANLMRAVEAAERELRHLEYWSDLRDAARDEEMLGKGEEAGEVGGGKDKGSA